MGGEKHVLDYGVETRGIKAHWIESGVYGRIMLRRIYVFHTSCNDKNYDGYSGIVTCSYGLDWVEIRYW